MPVGISNLFLFQKLAWCHLLSLCQVDRGVTLSEALLRHDKWLEKKGIKNSNFAVVTWSNWDCRVMLESECRYKKIRKPPYFNRYSTNSLNPILIFLCPSMLSKSPFNPLLNYFRQIKETLIRITRKPLYFNRYSTYINLTLFDPDGSTWGFHFVKFSVEIYATWSKQWRKLVSHGKVELTVVWMMPKTPPAYLPPLCRRALSSQSPTRLPTRLTMVRSHRRNLLSFLLILRNFQNINPHCCSTTTIVTVGW